MFKKPTTWLLVISGTAVLVGAILMATVGDHGRDDDRMVAGSVALAGGAVGFLFFVFWRLTAEGGVSPLTEKQQETVRNTLLSSVVGCFVGGAAAGGLAVLIFQRGGTAYWIVKAFGLIVGAFLGFEHARRSAREVQGSAQENTPGSPEQQQ
jgi:hypothetical protein